MADVGLSEFSPGPIYSLTPKESTLAVLALSDDEDAIFRPSISDQLKVGFFNLDRCTQTEKSDIVDLKEMTEVLQELLTEVNFLKSDIGFAKKTIEADFEDRLTRKSLELYVRINEKVENLQNMHKEKVENLRRAFRQQLADAITRLAALWDKVIDDECYAIWLKKRRKHLKSVACQKFLFGTHASQLFGSHQGSLDDWLAEYEAHYGQRSFLQALASSVQIIGEDSKVSAHTLPNLAKSTMHKKLNSSLGPDVQNGKSFKTKVFLKQSNSVDLTKNFEELNSKNSGVIGESFDDSSTLSRPERSGSNLSGNSDGSSRLPALDKLKGRNAFGKREATPPPPPPAVDDAELQDLKRKIAKLESMVDNLDSLNEEKTEEIRKLNAEVNKLQNQAAKDKIYLEEVEHELSQVKAAWDADKKSFTRMLDDQKKQYEKTMEQQIAQVREECMAQARMEVNKLSGQSEAELRRLREEKEAAELALSKERAKQLTVEPPKVEETDTDRLIANEKLWRSLVEKYKKEISRIQKAWEKKFAILQASLHALKDEAFLRHTLQRQAATLHQASVSYGVGVPVANSAKSKQREMTRFTATASPAPSPIKEYNHYNITPELDQELQDQLNNETGVSQPSMSRTSSAGKSVNNKERSATSSKRAGDTRPETRNSSAKTINIVLKTQ